MDPSTAAIHRLIDSILTIDLAEKIVALRADSELARRVEELGRKCNEGELSPDEKVEYETYVIANDYLAIIQAKARRVLQHQRA